MDIEETRFTRIGRLAMLLAANAVLALGPWLVRLADTGPVAAGFWRLTLARPRARRWSRSMRAGGR